MSNNGNVLDCMSCTQKYCEICKLRGKDPRIMEHDDMFRNENPKGYYSSGFIEIRGNNGKLIYKYAGPGT